MTYRTMVKKYYSLSSHITLTSWWARRCLISPDCLLKKTRCRSKKTSKLRATGLFEGNSPVTSEFPAQRASHAEMFAFDDVIMMSYLHSKRPQADTPACHYQNALCKIYSIVFDDVIMMSYLHSKRPQADTPACHYQNALCKIYSMCHDNRAVSRLAPSRWKALLQSNTISHWLGFNLESDFRLVPRQWETSLQSNAVSDWLLQSNAVSHWLGVNLESALMLPTWNIRQNGAFRLPMVTPRLSLFGKPGYRFHSRGPTAS